MALSPYFYLSPDGVGCYTIGLKMFIPAHRASIIGYDAEQDKWSDYPLPPPRQSSIQYAGLAQYGDGVVNIAGYDWKFDHYVEEIWWTNPGGTYSGKTQSKLMQGLYDLAVATLQSSGSNKALAKASYTPDRILIFGGKDSLGMTNNRTFIYTPPYQLDFTRVEISPNETTLRVGEKQQFAAKKVDTADAAFALAPVWSVDGGGAVDKNGLFSATSEGDFTITATDTSNSISGSAIIHVSGVVPVELAFFSAWYENNKVVLRWETKSESNNYGFEIERRINSDWEKIGFVKGHGSTAATNSYEFVDNDVNLGTLVQYRLKQINLDGSFVYSDVVNVELKSPASFSLAQNYPNPFNPTTTIEYAVKEPCNVELKVYDIRGREVVTLVDSRHQAGFYKHSFHAQNLPTGVYFYRIRMKDPSTGSGQSFVAVRKMALLQ